MVRYDSPSLAIDDLRRRGFTQDFNLADNCLVCNGQAFSPDDFEISEVYRFEGDSDPGDESVVYGIEGRNGVKGVLVNGYGYSSEPMGEAVVQKLRLHANG